MSDAASVKPKSVPMCPSSRCADGNTLLGIVNAEGRIDFIPERFEVDAAFVAIARQGRPPEQRFRFSSPCLARGCGKWDGKRCGVAKILNEHGLELLPNERTVALPRCSIRANCRWHGDYGDAICAICAWVVTESGNRLEPPA
ncbi:hypothetical protein [Bradyrhizobium sp. SZCCHNR2028]|uniref:hypothetical protein n=1 Tax=Bradyrhizobium sp. SZCCHNR2028 TaxID=3057382 RepID=UPI0028EF102D|nr:hypothetical protein [Bradyrhizobium sp. SZCCHNR2028]